MINITAPLTHVWEVSANSDMTEGRGVSIPFAYFTQKADADKASIGRGVMGTPAYVKQIPVPHFLIYESFAEFEDQSRESLREAALKKLTEEERDALGLTEPAKLKDREFMVPLTHRNNWESHEYCAGGIDLNDGALKAIRFIYVDGMAYDARAQKVTGTYSDHGKPGSATSLQLEILIRSNNILVPEAWHPIQKFMNQTPPHKIEIKIVKP